MSAIIKYLEGIDKVDARKQFKTIKGVHDSKARVDTNIKVFVKRLFCKALLSSCEATLPCRNFLQMPI